MKILLAEDEPISRFRIVKMLEGVGPIESFENGTDALAAFVKSFEEGAPFDMLILDVSMPEMDGIELLKKIRAFEKQRRRQQTKVLMLTSHADKDTVISCYVAGCDDYAVKPFKKSVVIQKMEKMGFFPDIALSTENELSISRMVSDAIEGFKQGKVDLPSLPFIVQEIQDMMNSPDATASEIAKIIQKDTAIAINLIKASNSSYYGGVETIKDVKMAINRLGLDQTSSLVTEIVNKGLYETKGSFLKPVMDQLWKHSLVVAYLARQIAGKVRSVKPEQAFVKGLVHDIGATLLIKNIDEIMAKGENKTEQERLIKENNASIEEVIKSVFEVHGSFGGTLFESWNFGKDFVDVARLHEWDKFNKKTDSEVLIVNLADRISISMGYGFPGKEDHDISKIQSAQLLGLSVDDLTSICVAVAQEIDDVLNVIPSS